MRGPSELPAMISATILAVTVVLLILAAFALIDELKRRWQVRQKEKRLATLLAGQSLEAILADSPYQYAHFQGEDGYRLYDERKRDEFVGSAATALDAHLWVVEHYLAEKEGEQILLEGGNLRAD